MKNPNMFLVASVVLILLGVALVAILDRNASSGNNSDVRARATSKNALTVTGVVALVDEPNSIIIVDNVQFSDTSRSGDAKNYGTWKVIAPPAFNYASVGAGTNVTIGVDPPTFLVSSYTMTALTIAPAK